MNEKWKGFARDLFIIMLLAGGVILLFDGMKFVYNVVSGWHL